MESRAEIVVIMPCGYGLEQAVEELETVRFPGGWDELPAVRSGGVFAVDASRYFSRPRAALGDRS
ncbi:MAG: hypothetical protein L0338_33120 [Acidobacteria bacterium]|nr:hypothetical protein [Acidobacteriota bacterium]